MLIALMTWCHMGGYAMYVWPSVGLVIAVLAYQVVKAYADYHRLLKQLRKPHASHS